MASRITGGFWNNFWKARTWLLEGFSQLVSEKSKLKNLFWNFPHKKTAKNCENHQRSFKNYCF
jgi:hypothetical protein